MSNEIVLYPSNELPERIELSLEDETAWLNRQQLAGLFGSDVKQLANTSIMYLRRRTTKKLTVFNFVLLSR